MDEDSTAAALPIEVTFEVARDGPMQSWGLGRIPASWNRRAAVAVLCVACAHPAKEPSGSFPTGVTRPRPATPIDWSYPPATTSKVVGTLSVRCIITEEGRAEECEPLKSVPDFDRWVIDKLESASFVPATRSGTPVRSSYLFNFRFDLPEAAVRWRPPLEPGAIDACKGSNTQGCMTAALGLLAPDGGAREVDRASRLLGAACAAGLPDACRKLDESFRAPRLLTEIPPPPASEFGGAEGEVTCWVSATGGAHDCRGPDSAPARWFIERLGRARFAPATFETEPFETEYAVRFSFSRY